MRYSRDSKNDVLGSEENNYRVSSKRTSSPETQTTRDSPNQGIEMHPMRIL